MSKRGFTLIELIVTITITAILLAIVSGFFAMALKTYRKTNAIKTFTSETLFLHSLLQNNIESLYHPYFDKDSQSFIGSNQGLTFVSIQDNEQGLFPRLVQLSYNPEQEQLDFIVWPYQNNTAPSAPLLQHSVHNVTSLSLRFFDVQSQTWTNTWSAVNHWPKLVELTIAQPSLNQAQTFIYEVIYNALL